MPFTVSHVAAVIPIARLGAGDASRWMPFSALVIGSMTPDFPYLVGETGVRNLWHSPLGMFTICLPVGLLSLLIFHAFLKEPLLWLLPAAHRLRLQPYATKFRWGLKEILLWPLQPYASTFPWRGIGQFLAVAAMLLLGSWTHKCWDELTHLNAVTRWLGLTGPAVTIEGTSFAIFSILQAASSVVGLLLVIYWYLAWFFAEPEPEIDPADRAASFARFLGAGCLLGAATLSVVCWNVIDLGWPNGLDEYLKFIYLTVIGVMATTTGLLVIYAGAFWALHFRRRPPTPADARLRPLSQSE